MVPIPQTLDIYILQWDKNPYDKNNNINNKKKNTNNNTFKVFSSPLLFLKILLFSVPSKISQPFY